MSTRFIEPFTKIEDYELYPMNGSHQLVFKGTKENVQNLTIIINKTSVKYLPKKFNKITVSLEDSKELEHIQKYFMEDVGIEEFIKDGMISLKLDENTKKLTEALKIGSVINIAVKFNGVWKMNKHQYASWKLVDFEEVEVVPVKFF